MKYAKAYAALLGAIATWGITAAPDYTQTELWGLLGVVATGLAVRQTTNVEPEAPAAEPEAGYGLIELAVGVVVLLILIVVLFALIDRL